MHAHSTMLFSGSWKCSSFLSLLAKALGGKRLKG